MALNTGMVGVTMEEYLQSVQGNTNLKAPKLDEDKRVGLTLPASGWAQSLQRMMIDMEDRRVAAAGGGMHMWPMQWMNNVCTGKALDLYRVSREQKRDNASGEMVPNPNYGRWYVAKRVPVMHNGQPVTNSETGYPETRLDGFTWFDETTYVQMGAFHAKAPGPLVDLMLYTYGQRVHDGVVDLWPADSAMEQMVNGTFRDGDKQQQQQQQQQQHPRPPKHRGHRGLA